MEKFNQAMLITPCGMNCGVCYAFLREKNRCPGCRLLKKDIPVSIARCKIRNCGVMKNGGISFCHECKDFSCKDLQSLDKRYRAKYRMSQIENLEFIKKNGIRKFVKNEGERWRCEVCGGKICVHKAYCLVCGR